jgi:predicted Zn-ribbon and HTH transcriptional regulator
MTPENKYLHYDNNHGRVSLMANKVCKRCGHKWQKRTAGKPVQCPNCRSVKWDVARKVKP